MSAGGPALLGRDRPAHPWIAEGADRLRFAICGMFASTPAEIVNAAQRAERLGFDAYWANDHPNRSIECWDMLTMLAMATESIRLVSLVSCIYYRSPFLLAREAADVDAISGGRLVLGLGIGDDVAEFSQMGLDFPARKDRQEALEETLTIVRGLWQGERFSFQGKHFQVRDAAIRQLPVQQPFVPILIGGGGERVTLRQVAEFADVSNFAPHEWSGAAYQITDVQRKYRVLREHCQAVGRAYESILRTHYTPLLALAEDGPAVERKRAAARIPDASLRQELVFATASEAIEHYQALADAGVQYFLVSVNFQDEETVRIFAEEVVPAVKLPATGPLTGVDRDKTA